MAVATFVLALFAVVWSDHILTVSSDNHRETWPTVVFGSARTVRSRSARDMQEMRANTQGLELTPDLKTTGQKFSSDEYHTLSSLTSDNAVVDEPPATQKVSAHPPLPIADSTPPPLISPPSFITRGRYVGSSPHLFGNGDGGRAYRPDIFVDSDQIPEYSTSNGNAMSKWNRYYSGHRQLKKYGPMIMETDMTMTDSGGGGGGGAMYNGYDNGLDYGQIEAESYKNPIGGGGSAGDNAAVGWYSEPATMASRPAAEIRDPGSSSKVVSLDMKKLVLLVVIKAVLAKLKLLAVLKFFAVMFVKAKLLALFKVFLFTKFTVLSRLFRLCVLPFVPNILLWLRTAALMQLNPPAPGTGMNNNNNMMMADMNANANVVQLRNDSVADPVNMRSTDLNAIGTAADLFQFVATVQSAKCVERTACHVASVRPLSLQSVWLNWILSSMANYIPSKKLKSYVLTFKDVSDYRMENIFSHPSTEEWSKWCDERYYCDEE